MEQQEQSIGALWSKQSKNNTEYLSGNVTINNEKIVLVVFKNTKKEGNQPDWRIFRQKTMSPQKPEVIENKTIQPKLDEIKIEDIPF